MSSSVTPERHAVAVDGIRCEGDFYVPENETAPWPTVVMANVFGASRSWGLPPFARRFATAGIAAFVFDYRHLGASGGRPRRLIEPDRQLEDWRAVVDAVRSMERVDSERTALWGSSFSGGHVLIIAREDPDVQAVISLVPFVDGRAVMAHQTAHLRVTERIRTFGLAVADRLAAIGGYGPVEVPIVSEPNDGGLVDTPGAMEGFLSIVPPEADLVNKMPARFVLELPFYRPGTDAREIDVPVHVAIAERDRLLPIEPMERLVDRLSSVDVQHIDGGHFDAYHSPQFENVVERQVEFLATTIGSAD